MRYVLNGWRWGVWYCTTDHLMRFENSQKSGETSMSYSFCVCFARS